MKRWDEIVDEFAAAGRADRRRSDKFLDAEREAMESKPFDPGVGESAGAVFGGLVLLAVALGCTVLAAVILYMIGKAVVG